MRSANEERLPPLPPCVRRFSGGCSPGSVSKRRLFRRPSVDEDVDHHPSSVVTLSSSSSSSPRPRGVDRKTWSATTTSGTTTTTTMVASSTTTMVASASTALLSTSKPPAMTASRRSTSFSSRRRSFAARCLTGATVASCAVHVLRTDSLLKRNFYLAADDGGRFDGTTTSLLEEEEEEEEVQGRRPTRFDERYVRGERRRARVSPRVVSLREHYDHYHDEHRPPVPHIVFDEEKESVSYAPSLVLERRGDEESPGLNASLDALGSRFQTDWDDDCVLAAPEWQATFHPTCNLVHEFDLVSSPPSPKSVEKRKGRFDDDGSSRDTTSGRRVALVHSGGSWRATWRVRQRGRRTLALKTLRLDRAFNAESFEHQRVDAVAMERLTASPHVVAEYAFCGQSVVTDHAEGTASSLVKNPRLKPADRLRLARGLAEGLAAIHGVDDATGHNATLVHNDINPSNVVRVGNSSLMFNDFNVGVLLRWNVVKNEPCPIPVIFEDSIWRSPEELVDPARAREKTDVYALGNVLFQILTTREPWKWLEPGGRPTVERVLERKRRGDLPFVPPEFSEGDDRHPATVALHAAVLACYERDVDRRPTARAIADKLTEADERLRTTGATDDETRERVETLFRT